MKATALRIGLSAAVMLSFMAGCATTAVENGMIQGGLIGAGLGAIAGHQSGQQGEGALIGAAAGAITGGLIGERVGQDRQGAQVSGRAYAPSVQAPAPVAAAPPADGHYESRIVVSESGEKYEERFWVPNR
jgi:hypothetical protein